MRICYITHDYPTRQPRGGIGLHIQQIARGLVDLGHDVHVVCAYEDAEPADEMDLGVAVHFVPPTRVRVRRIWRNLSRIPGLGDLGELNCGWGLVEISFGAWLAVARLQMRRRFDLVEAVDVGGIACCGLLLPRWNLPVIIRGHGTVDPSLPGMQWPGVRFQYWLEGVCLRRADHVATNSHFLRDTCVAQYGLDNDRVTALDIVIDGPQFAEAVSDVRRQRGWSADDPIMLYVGRIEYLKGSDILFMAMDCARQQVPNLRLVLLGETMPSMQEEYGAFMARWGESTWHPGNVPPDQVSSIMRQSTALILPSRKETFGRVVVEAQFTGLPAIGSRVGGIPEIISDGKTGWLVDPGDADALAGKIVDICRDRDGATQMGQTAQKRATQRYEFSRTLQQTLAFYQTIAHHVSA
jgi:glycogen synthase